MPKADDDGPSALQWFLSELDRIDGCERTKEGVRGLLRSMVGERLRITRRDLTIAHQHEVADAILAAGFRGADAARELANRTGLCVTQAHRYIVAAIDRRAKADAIRRTAGGA